jgi:hypothetical protein
MLALFYMTICMEVRLEKRHAIDSFIYSWLFMNCRDNKSVNRLVHSRNTRLSTYSRVRHELSEGYESYWLKYWRLLASWTPHFRSTTKGKKYSATMSLISIYDFDTTSASQTSTLYEKSTTDFQWMTPSMVVLVAAPATPGAFHASTNRGKRNPTKNRLTHGTSPPIHPNRRNLQTEEIIPRNRRLPKKDRHIMQSMNRRY